MSKAQSELVEMGVGETRVINGCDVKRTPGGVWTVSGKYCPTLPDALAAVGGESCRIS